MRFPSIMQRKNINTYIWYCFNYKTSEMYVSTTKESISINFADSNVILSKVSLMPEVFVSNTEKKVITYDIELNSVENVKI